ncbi:MAG TPA: nuclear transport factor 2 family protein, partial [Sphingobium sp.]
TAAILDAEKQRCAAMLKNDAAGLDAILDPRLSFAHATGAVDDKAAYLAKMAEGKIDYIAIEWTDPVVTGLGDGHALLNGRMGTHVRVNGVEKQLDNRVTTVWAAGDKGWRLLAFQSTPMKV